jgi:hypothetical protein
MAADAALWEAALAALGGGSDHTEISRFLEQRPPG